MKVYFIGAGPGAADLITLRGARLLGEVDMVLYAGSLVPVAMLEHCKPGAELIDTAELNLEQQQDCYLRAQAAGSDVVRLHSGDPAIYGATAEQMRRLDALGIAYDIVPGVSSFTAAAAAIQTELTKPEVSQSVILTRVSGRASAVPELESIARLAEHRATMCIFLSATIAKRVQEQLLAHYPADTPVAILYRVSWDDEEIYTGQLADLAGLIRTHKLTRTVLIVVGTAIGARKNRSQLYHPDWKHIFRTGQPVKVKKAKKRADDAPLG